MIRNGLIVIVILLVMALILNALPAVEHGRTTIPDGIAFGKDCGCDCISQARPWYSTLNYWLWFWVISIPVFAFSLNIIGTGWKKNALFVLAIIAAAAASYVAINLSIALGWDIRNGPFSGTVRPDEEEPITSCLKVGDGGSLTFTLLLGWIPACFYLSFWMLVRSGCTFLFRKLNLITEQKKKFGTLSKILDWYFMASGVLFILLIILIWWWMSGIKR